VGRGRAKPAHCGWISIKEILPPHDEVRSAFVLASHTIYGVGVAWFWVSHDDFVEELERSFRDKYLCSCQFIMNMLDDDFGIDSEDDIDVFEHSPHFRNLGTVTHWMPLPQPILQEK